MGGQLTANYTDSEGEEDPLSDEGSHGSSPEHSRVSELREGDGVGKGTPASVDTTGSGTNTPVKKGVNRLVSYSYGAVDDEELEEGEGEEEDKDIVDEPDEVLNPEPMDTGTDEEDEASPSTHSRERDLGIALPPPPPGKAS